LTPCRSQATLFRGKQQGEYIPLANIQFDPFLTFKRICRNSDMPSIWADTLIRLPSKTCIVRPKTTVFPAFSGVWPSWSKFDRRMPDFSCNRKNRHLGTGTLPRLTNVSCDDVLGPNHASSNLLQLYTRIIC
jgi:hypothetical protein